MAPRYLVIAARTAGSLKGRAVSRLLLRAARDYDLLPIFGDGERLVLASLDMPRLLIADGGGVVIGHLFHRNDDARPVQPGAPLLSRSAVGASGLTLIREAWGGYVAVIADRQPLRTHVLRDPSGVMPCFHAVEGAWDLFFSDLEPVLGLGLVKPLLDRDFVAHYLAFRGLRTARTGLAGITEVLAGTRTSVGPAGVETTCCWTPWTYADRAVQIGNRTEAVRRVRQVTESCVRAWAGTAQSILLELSGGLDSSIVAACLSDQAAKVACVTLVTPDPGADERRYAELAAAIIPAPLAAVGLSADTVDLRQPPQIRLPRPGLGSLQQIADQAFLAQARVLQPDAFFGGGGGDNVFCYLATAAPAVDAWLMRGPGATALQALDDLSRIYHCTVWRAAWLAFKKRLRGPGPPWRSDLRFIQRDGAPARCEPHPWLERPAGALPGKIEQIYNLMHIQTAPDGKARPMVAPVRHPLLSQPIVELCLSIPSWMWIEGGINRSVARDAFRDRLPPQIADRRSKGEFVGFSGAIFARNRQVLAERLLGGWLDQAGILDRAAVERYLADAGPPRDPHYFRLLEIAGVETWARSWAGEGASAGLR